MSPIVEKNCIRSALLIIDVQAWIFERQDPIYNEDSLIKNINMLEVYAHNNSFPVTYIQHESSGNMKKNSSGWKLHKGLNPQPDDIFIGKRKGNSFYETPLHAILQEKKICRVLICGLLSQQCILKTTLGALDLGYETILLSDAHSNSGMYPLKNISMVHKTVKKAGAILLSTADVIS